MGYFSNGTEGQIYEATYCRHCRWYRPVEKGGAESCPVLDAHLWWNYQDCNEPGSPLHKMIPRDGIENLRCVYFEEAADADGDGRVPA